MTLDYLSRVMHLNRRSESAFARRNFLRKLSARSGHEWANGVALTQKHSSGWFERLLAGMIPKSFCNCWPGACESTPRFPKLLSQEQGRTAWDDARSVSSRGTRRDMHWFSEPLSAIPPFRPIGFSIKNLANIPMDSSQSVKICQDIQSIRDGSNLNPLVPVTSGDLRWPSVCGPDQVFQSLAGCYLPYISGVPSNPSLGELENSVGV